MAHLQIGPGEVKQMGKQLVSAKQRLKRLEVKAEEVVSGVVHTAEVSAAAFVSGLAKGWKGEISFMGVPVELLAAGVLHTAGYAGLGGHGAHHLHGFGDGFLASYMVEIGRGAGVGIRERGKTSVKGESLTDEQLASMAEGRP